MSYSGSMYYDLAGDLISYATKAVVEGAMGGGYNKKKRKREEEQTLTVTTSGRGSGRGGNGSSGSSRMVRGGSLILRNDPLRASVKIERGVNVLGYNAVYIGGVTHPAQYTTGMMVQALIRFMMIKANIDFGSFDDEMVAPGLTTQNFSFEYWWRQDTRNPTALAVVTVASTGLATWGAWAGAIIDSLIGTLGIGPVGTVPDQAAPTRRIVYIGLRGAGTAPIIASQFYKADEIFVTVKGESSIQVQNRTKTDTVAPSEDSSNIYSNPLRGKYYTFKRGRPLIKNPGNVTAAQYTFFPYDQTSGTITSYDTLATSQYSSTVALALKKPPPGYFFSNSKSQKYISCSPGEIIRSKVQSEITLSLTSWCIKLRPKWFQAAVKSFSGLATLEDPYEYQLGESHIYGLEKMCDTAVAGAGKEVAVGIEHNLYMASRCMWRPKCSVLPQVTITTT